MSPFFSIIIPTYNRANFLGRAIESVIGQGFPDWELIVVDDGSTDTTGEVVKPYLLDERIRYHYQKNRELNGARNTGVALMKGEYGCFLDDDDEYLPNHLDCLRTAIVSRGNEFSLFKTGLIIQYANSKRVETSKYQNSSPQLSQHWESPSNLLPYAIRADVLQEYIFDEKDLLLDDFIWLNRVLLNHEFLQLADYTVVYYVHNLSRSATYVNEDRLGQNLLKVTRAYTLPGVSAVVSKQLYERRVAHEVNHFVRQIALSGNVSQAIRLWLKELHRMRPEQWREWGYSLVVMGRSVLK